VHFHIMDFKPIRISFGYNKSVTAKRNGDFLNVYINDNLFDEEKHFVKEKKQIYLVKGRSKYHYNYKKVDHLKRN